MLSFGALADPTRRRIVELLAGGERSAGDIVAQFDMSAPAISQHLKVLRNARLVSVRVAGQHRFHALDIRGIDEISAWIVRMKGFWEGRLDALERALRAEGEGRKRTLRRRSHIQSDAMRPKRVGSRRRAVRRRRGGQSGPRSESGKVFSMSKLNKKKR
jgi:DNA-binding transcriptional ArsR family regulator